MPRKSMQVLTDSMFYILMALSRGEMCGQDIAAAIDALTESRIQIGPATLYTILSKFLKEGIIEETPAGGRKRNYKLTESGKQVYQQEKERLLLCLEDAKRMETYEYRQKDAAVSVV